jgi:hypothetical protein
MRYVIFALAALASFAVHADTVVATWVNPTTATNGGPVGTITSTRIEHGSCSGTSFGTKAGEWVQNGNGTTSTSPNLPAGTHCFRAFTRTPAGESAASNVAQKVIAAPLPNPPTGLSVSDPTAYEIRTSGGQLVATRVGMVGVGTICSGESQTVAGIRYNRVELRDTDLINFPTGSMATLKAWARCS